MVRDLLNTLNDEDKTPYAKEEKALNIWHVVDIPLNKEGKGPEMNPDEVVKTIYEVWDCAFYSIAETVYKPDAELIAKALNHYENFLYEEEQ